MQQEWQDLKLRVSQLEVGTSALEKENKALRFLLETIIEHRQKSHGELVMMLTGLVSKLPINDVGVIVAKLVEHQNNLSHFLAGTIKGTVDAALPAPDILKTLEHTKRDLAASLKPEVEELIRLETPFECGQLESLASKPDLFFSPSFVRTNRCFVKGQLPRERIIREFGEAALIFFNDLTTDPKLNPRPKPDEIVLGFKPDFETLFQQNPTVLPEKRDALLGLFQRIQQTKAPTEKARAQKNAFTRLSFLIELLHFYENQSTEAPDVIFAQRLPVLVEQLVISGAGETLDEKLVLQAESLLAFVINPDHRLMVINNVGKGSFAGKTLKYVLRLRAEKSAAAADAVVAEFVKHLFPPQTKKAPAPEGVTAVLRLLTPDMQRLMVKAIMISDRLRKQDAAELGKAVGAQLGLTGLESLAKAEEQLPPELERQIAWAQIKAMIAQRTDPATVAAAIRERLHAKYDADEMKQSWITLMEADPISFIRVFCQLPYLANGKTDPVAQTAMATYATRLTHEKYASTYTKVVNSLKNMFHAKPDSPTLLNFIALIKWVSPDAGNKLAADVGMVTATA
jgi:hypothetical protein